MATNEEIAEFIQSFRDLNKEMRDSESVLMIAAKGFQNEINVLKEAGNRAAELEKVQKKLNNAYDVARATIVKNKKELLEYQKIQEKLNKEVEYALNPLKKYVDESRKLADIVSKVSRGMVTFMGHLGVGELSWKKLIDVSLKYNKSLFDLSRIQTTTGTGFKSISSTLDYVSKQTKMSSMQFLELSNTMMKGFVGVRPSIESLARTMGDWGEQMGYNYESVTALLEVQQKLPALYNKIAQGLSLMSNANKGDKGAQEKVKGIRAEAEAWMLVNGASQQARDTISQSLTEQTAGEKEYASLLKLRAAQNQSVQDLELKFAKDFIPLQKIMLEFASGFVKLISEHRAMAVGLVTVVVAVKSIASAFTVATIAAEAFGKKSAMALARSGWGLAILALGAVVGLIMKINQMTDEAAQAQEEANSKLKIQAVIQNDINQLNTEQKKAYDEKIAVMEKEAEQQEKISGNYRDAKQKFDDMAAAHGRIIKEVTAEGFATKQLVARWEEARANTTAYQAALSASRDTMKNMVSTTEQFGGTAREAQAALIGISQLDLSAQEESFKAAGDTAKAFLRDMGVPIKLNLTGSLDQQLEELRKKMSEVMSSNMTKDQKGEAFAALNLAYKEGNEILTKRSDILKQQTDLATTQMRQMESYTSAFEAKLDAERRLMESAQFGLGASVEMMQKQVNLAEKMMKTYEKTDKNFENIARSQGKASNADIERIKNAGTIEEAEDYILNTMGAQGNQANALTQYAYQHQVIGKKLLDQQQKIYDLTKNVREGYLDAIREMSSGAGEFEKIIGTQEMGVSQLMDVVKDVTGEEKLNTMKLGGRQGKGQTAAGVGTEYTGQYTAGGAKFIGGEEQNARNARIFQYQSSVDKANEIKKGNVSGGNTVGTGNVPGAENYIAPEREAEIQGKVIGEEIVDAFGRSGMFDALRGVNVGALQGRFNVGEAAKIGGGGQAGQLGAAYGRNSTQVGGRGNGGGVLSGGGNAGGSGGVSGVSSISQDEISQDEIYRKDLSRKIEEAKMREGKESKAKEDYDKAMAERAKTETDIKKRNIMIGTNSKTGKAEVRNLDFNYDKVNEEFGTMAADVGYGIDKITSGRQWTHKKIKSLANRYGLLPDDKRGKKNQADADAINTANEKVEAAKNTWMSTAKGNKGMTASSTLEQQQNDAISKAEAATEKYNDEQRKARNKKAEDKARQEEADAKQKQAEFDKMAAGLDKGMYKGIKRNAPGKTSAEAAWEMANNDVRDKEAEEALKKYTVLNQPYKDQEALNSPGMMQGLSKGEQAAIKARAAAKSATPSTPLTSDQYALAQKDEAVRKQLGVVKPKKGQTQAQAEASKLTQMYLQQHVEQLNPEDFKKAMEQRSRIEAGSRLPKDQREMAAKIVDEKAASKNTSAAAAAGMESSDEAQSRYVASRGYTASTYGASGDVGGAGGGGAVVTIRLAAGLEAAIEEMTGVSIEVQKASTSAT